MKNTKLLSVLTILKPPEWKRLRKFILMYTSREADPYMLCSILYKHRNDLSDLGTLEDLRSKHFPQLTTKGLSNIMSRLYLWVEEFLVFDLINQNKNKSELLLTQIYNRRGKYKLADQTADRLEKRLASNDKITLETSRTQSELYYYQYYSDNPIKYREKGKLLEKLALSTQRSYADTLHLLAIEMSNWQMMYGYDYDTIQLDIGKILDITCDSHNREILQLVDKVVSQQDFKAYEKLKKMLLTGTVDTNDDLHTLASMYYISNTMIFWGKSLIMNPKEIIEAHTYGLKSRVLFKDGEIPSVRFHNIIDTVAGFQSENATYKFINIWYKFVKTVDFEATKKIALAQNHSYHANYSLILEELRGVKYFDSEKNRVQKLVLIALCMERKKDYSLLRTSLLNYSRYLKRTKTDLSTREYTGGKNLVNFIEKIVFNDFKKITLSISQYKIFPFKNWALKIIRDSKLAYRKEIRK